MYQLTRFQLVILNQGIYTLWLHNHMWNGSNTSNPTPTCTWPYGTKLPASYISMQLKSRHLTKVSRHLHVYSVIYSPVTSTESASFSMTSLLPRFVPISLASQQYCHSAGVSSVTVSTLVLTGCPRLLNMIRRVAPSSEISSVKLSQEPPATFVLLHMNVFGEITPSGAVAMQVIVNWL